MFKLMIDGVDTPKLVSSQREAKRLMQSLSLAGTGSKLYRIAPQGVLFVAATAAR